MPDLVAFTEKTAKAAGEIALSLFGRVESESKGESLVSRADREVEEFIVSEIRAAFPGDPVLGEEGGASGTQALDPARRWWAIDPIDGTGPYLKGLPFWAVSIACLTGGRVEAGVVHMPAMGETFTAGARGHALRNGAPIPPVGQGVPDSHDYLFVPCGEVPRLRHEYPGEYLALGSAACHVCYAATGSGFGVLMEPLHVYDFAAAALVYERAGGRVDYLSGAAPDYRELGDGRKTPEPVLAAPAEQIRWLGQRVFWE